MVTTCRVTYHLSEEILCSAHAFQEGVDPERPELELQGTVLTSQEIAHHNVPGNIRVWSTGQHAINTGVLRMSVEYNRSECILNPLHCTLMKSVCTFPC